MLNTYRYTSGKFPVDFFSYVLTGDDVSFFLQNQSTYNFNELPVGEFHLVSFLDPHGKIEFYAWALKKASEVQLLVPLLLKDAALTRLEKFLISEDVNIETQGVQTWWAVLGPIVAKLDRAGGFTGILLEESALLIQTLATNELPQIKNEEMDQWITLNGWPSFDGSDFSGELINNLRLYDLSVSENKGCYPGQETVSKIATRRGAAYSPVLLKTTEAQTPGVIYIFDKKIGEIEKSYFWEGFYYSSTKLMRDFRVSNMSLKFLKDNQEHEAVVKYYPLLSGSSSEKSQELFDLALEHFKNDDYVSAETNLRKAIELNSGFADAYEALGVILGRLERFDEAIVLMDHLTKVDPTSVLAHTNKSLFLMKQGKIDEAEQEKSLATIKSFQKFGDEAKQNELIAQEKKAREEEWAKRENMFLQVLEIDDQDTLANYGIGSIAVEKSDWSRAIDHLEKVVSADANYSVAYLALGKAYKGVGDFSRARTAWENGLLIAAKKGDLMPANQMQVELQSLKS
jgi:folate-binding Fe-S cluster repair protein YgfZ/Flp pilus assembly protein TadD